MSYNGVYFGSYNYTFFGFIDEAKGYILNKVKEYKKAQRRNDLFKQATQPKIAEIKAQENLNKLIEIRTERFIDSDESLAQIEAQRIQAAQDRINEIKRKNNEIALALLID